MPHVKADSDPRSRTNPGGPRWPAWRPAYCPQSSLTRHISRSAFPGTAGRTGLRTAQLNHVTGSDNRMMWLENSGYIVTEDYEREVVYRAIDSFIEQHI